jgi:nucleoside-diphosphate-sugar epimerase
MIVAQQLCARCRRRVKRSYGDVAPVIVDALDQKALEDAVRRAAPTHVVHELTALPKAGARRASDLEPTNRLRDEATRNLLAAAIAARVQRIVVGSFALIGSAPGALTSDGQIDAASLAVRSMESQILKAARRGVIEGVVLRYGLFYEPAIHRLKSVTQTTNNTHSLGSVPIGQI